MSRTIRTRSRLKGARRPVQLLAVAGSVSAALLLAPTQSASAFGTYGSNGQSHEHERITRAALSCDSALADKGSCFQARSMDQVAGNNAQLLTGKGLGAVGAPDRTQIMQETAHCDNADYFDDPSYPVSRADATKKLQGCVENLQTRFKDGAELAGGVLTGSGAVAGDQVDVTKDDCNVIQSGYEQRAKCKAFKGFGEALHGVQDFYAHGNWTDRPDPGKPVGIHNPPGLNRQGPSPLLDLTADEPPSPADVPKDFSTGCFSLSGGCTGRIQHYDDMHKDSGQIDPKTGATSDPASPRGKVAGNFDRAVHGAIAETQRQWRDFQAQLKEAYGQEKGARIVCALTHDNPVADCR
ncbi:CinY protein [Streptomyces gamaensis]|uniref:CinY protein n=1 Tax=Streptomyces gamaensis TaxID=1763542 RepID=A0ABW0ZAK9_9ACTN